MRSIIPEPPSSLATFGSSRWTQWTAVAEQAGTRHVDLVVGGPPCQGFSSAGKKVACDPRNDLFKEFARVVEHFRPRMFLLENVPGFAKRYDGRAWAHASKLFSDLGYQFVNRVVYCADYGIPQRRQRFVAVGWLPGLSREFCWPSETYSAIDGRNPIRCSTAIFHHTSRLPRLWRT